MVTAQGFTKLRGLRNFVAESLVHLQQQRVAGLVIDGLLHASDVGHCKVVSNDLGWSANLGGEGGPGRPIVLDSE